MSDRTPHLHDATTPEAPAEPKGQLGPLGISGRIARFFQDSQLTPLLALVAFLIAAVFLTWKCMS